MPIWPNFENGLDWQCCLAGSSKTAPRISIFLIADYSLYVKSIATYAPAFLRDNNSVLARVLRKMRSTMGEKKNEVHLVTDGHDKKLNPKQPFFNLSSQPAAEKGRLSVKHNRVKFFLK